MERDYRVIPIDLNQEMVAQFRAKGLDAQLMDLEDLRLEAAAFDGIWCHTALIHLEEKGRIRPVLERFAVLLKDGAPLFVAVREGEGERWERYHDRPGTERWFLYFREGEFERYIPPIFRIEESHPSEFESGGRRFLNYRMVRDK